MRAACFAPSFHQKRGEMKGGWLQVGSSHFNLKILTFIGHYSMKWLFQVGEIFSVITDVFQAFYNGWCC